MSFPFLSSSFFFEGEFLINDNSPSYNGFLIIWFNPLFFVKLLENFVKTCRARTKTSDQANLKFSYAAEIMLKGA